MMPSPALSLPNGYSARPARVEDAPAMLTLSHVISLKLVGEIEETLDEIVAEMTAPYTTLELDTRLIHDASGQLIGFGWVSLQVPQDVNIDLYLHPDLWESDTQIMPYLMDWAQTRALHALIIVPAQERVTMTAWCHHHDEWYQRQLGRIGLATVRSTYQMWIDFDGALPGLPFPEGVTVRTVSRDEDWQRVWGARREAWHDMWGYIPRTSQEDYADWIQYWNRNFADDYWFIAEKAGIVIALCLCEADYNGQADVSYVTTVGVRRAHRKQGLGLALLRFGLGQLQQRGKRAAALSVDATSLTGAVGLYERAGMHIKMRLDRMQKELRAGIDQRVHTAGAETNFR